MKTSLFLSSLLLLVIPVLHLLPLFQLLHILPLFFVSLQFIIFSSILFTFIFSPPFFFSSVFSSCIFISPSSSASFSIPSSSSQSLIFNHFFIFPSSCSYIFFPFYFSSPILVFEYCCQHKLYGIQYPMVTDVRLLMLLVLI